MNSKCFSFIVVLTCRKNQKSPVTHQVTQWTRHTGHCDVFTACLATRWFWVMAHPVLDHISCRYSGKRPSRLASECNKDGELNVLDVPGISNVSFPIIFLKLNYISLYLLYAYTSLKISLITNSHRLTLTHSHIHTGTGIIKCFILGDSQENVCLVKYGARILWASKPQSSIALKLANALTRNVFQYLPISAAGAAAEYRLVFGLFVFL